MASCSGWQLSSSATTVVFVRVVCWFLSILKWFGRKFLLKLICLRSLYCSCVYFQQQILAWFAVSLFSQWPSTNKQFVGKIVTWWSLWCICCIYISEVQVLILPPVQKNWAALDPKVCGLHSSCFYCTFHSCSLQGWSCQGRWHHWICWQSLFVQWYSSGVDAVQRRVDDQ